MKTLEQSHADLVEFLEEVIRHSDRITKGRTSECSQQYQQAKKLLATAPKPA